MTDCGTRGGLAGRYVRAGAAGFTLLEIMVVLVIIGIMAGVLVASLGPPPDEALKRERQLVVTAMEQLRLDAMIAGTATALETDSRGWRALVFDPVKLQWQPAQDARAYELPNGISLVVKTRSLFAATVPVQADQSQRIYFLGSGENTPFELHLRDRAGTDIALYSDGFNLATELPAAPAR